VAGEQSSHAVTPVELEKDPGAQILHWSDESALIFDKYLPTSHALHVDDP